MKIAHVRIRSAVALILVELSWNSALGHTFKKPDFNGDGYADLVVGAPGEGILVGGINQPGAGAINVIYGNGTGLNASTPVANQSWDQGTLGVDIPEKGDHFGAALAFGDFNHDGFTDVAIGVPGEDGGLGAVDVVYGSGLGLSLSAAIKP